MRICLGLTEKEAENTLQIKARQSKTKQKTPSPYWKFKVGNTTSGKKISFYTLVSAVNDESK